MPEAEGTPRVGIVCPDPYNTVELQKRLWISDGVFRMSSDEANGWGYRDLGLGAIIPKPPRRAERGEEKALVATRDTLFPMHLVTVPECVIRALRKEYRRRVASAQGLFGNETLVEYMPGFEARPLGERQDGPHSITVSVDPSRPDPYTGEPGLVGCHMDAWGDAGPHTLYGIFNIEGGPRRHIISSNAILDTSPTSQKAVFELVDEVGPDNVKMFWIQLKGPSFRAGQKIVEALVDVPTSFALHDGSVIDPFWQPGPWQPGVGTKDERCSTALIAHVRTQPEAWFLQDSPLAPSTSSYGGQPQGSMR